MLQTFIPHLIFGKVSHFSHYSFRALESNAYNYTFIAAVGFSCKFTLKKRPLCLP